MLHPIDIIINKTCRLCLFEGFESDVVQIFNNAEEVALKIKECVSLELENDNKLPTVICLNCLQQLNQLIVFKNRCYESQNILLEAVKARQSEDEKCNDVPEDSSGDDVSSMVHNDNKQFSKKTKSKVKYKKCNDPDKNDETEMLKKFLINLDRSDKKSRRRTLTKDFNYECDICQSNFNNICDYLDHQESHNGQAVFNCQKCNKVFSYRSELVDHENQHRKPCPKCNKMILPGCLKTHLVLHTDRFKCMDCNWRFYNSTMLKQHINSVHIRLKSHTCETCGKSFTTMTSLQTHMKIHSDTRSYTCKICNYSGRTSSALYTHMARHENGLNVCETCTKSFKSVRSLRDHIRRVHSKMKNHECGFCNKKFVDKYMLTVHMRTHTGSRPYQCSICERAFVRSDGLREHLATHGERSNYSCEQCGKKFIYRRSLGRHTCINK